MGNAALETRVRARYRSYLFETGGNESWRLACPPTEAETAIFREDRLGAREFEETIPIEHHVDWDARDDVTWIVAPPWRGPAKGDRTQDAEAAQQLLGALEYSATDYFGNEGSDATFYESAALLLEVPAARQRRARLARSLLRDARDRIPARR